MSYTHEKAVCESRPRSPDRSQQIQQQKRTAFAEAGSRPTIQRLRACIKAGADARICGESLQYFLAEALAIVNIRAHIEEEEELQQWR
jgi:hypothetical protein